MVSRIPLTAPGQKAYSERTPFLDALQGLLANTLVVSSDSLRVQNETQLVIPYYDANGTLQERTIELPGEPDILTRWGCYCNWYYSTYFCT